MPAYQESPADGVTSNCPRDIHLLLIFSHKAVLSRLKNTTPISLSSLQIPTVRSYFPSQNNPPHLLRFRTSYTQSLNYLKNLGIISNNKKPLHHSTLSRILSIVNFLKSKGFSDPQLQRLSFLCPQIFSSDISDFAAVFSFLSDNLSASPSQSNGLISRCPQLLISHVDSCLRPTLIFLQELGLQKLNFPTSLNAHLLNSRVVDLLEKIAFLESLGLSQEEAQRICARLPAVFGYSVENNLRPKFEYLVKEMGRSVEELKSFPQYFAFSLERRIVLRHLHLNERGVPVPLQRMLLWSDQRFYAKWK